MTAGKIVYEGIRQVINGKAVFMRQSMQYEQVFGLVEARLKDKEFHEILNRYRIGGKRKERRNAYTGNRIEEPEGSSIFGELTEEGWEYLFDQVFSRKISRCLAEREDPVYRMYALPMFENGMEKTVDVTGFLVYAILYNKRCREMLWAEIPSGDDYYDYYDQSCYCQWALEEGLKAEEIWDARVLTGLLEKMRQEERCGYSYCLLMRIIYAGYAGLRQWMEGKHMVTGSEIKAHVFAAHSEEYSMLYCISEMVTALVIAQDRGVGICFDYEMLVLLHFMEIAEKEMREGAYGVQECGGTEAMGGEDKRNRSREKKDREKQNGERENGERESGEKESGERRNREGENRERENRESENRESENRERENREREDREKKNGEKESRRTEDAGMAEERMETEGIKTEGMENEECGKFFKKFRKKHGTDSSLEALVFGSETKRMDRLLLGVMAQYHINPRMFCGLDLTEDEVRALQGLDDQWTEKSYWSMLVIAHMCKYISRQKGSYLLKKKG